MIANLFNIRNVAIIAALCLTAFTVQSLRIKAKNSKIDRLQVEIVRLTAEIDKAVSANETNQQTISELSEANQQCVLNSQVNEANSKAQVLLHRERIADITEKFNEIRKKKSTSICGTTPISADDLNLLQTRGGN